MRDRVIQALFQAIDELNATRAPDAQITKSEETVLLGNDGLLDSMEAVNFLLTAEQKLGELCGQQLSVAEQLLMAGDGDQARVPTTVEAFTVFVEDLIDGRTDGG